MSYDEFTDGKLLAGHDISDGGLITCLLEMCFGGMAGMMVDVEQRARGGDGPLETLFAEEPGWVLEVRTADKQYVKQAFRDNNVPCLYLGDTTHAGMDAKVISSILESWSLNCLIICLVIYCSSHWVYCTVKPIFNFILHLYNVNIQYELFLFANSSNLQFI